jgi:hypothetical protein
MSRACRIAHGASTTPRTPIRDTSINGKGPHLMTMLILLGGAATLVYFAVLIGMSMDTERQRVVARQIAAERRALQEEKWVRQEGRSTNAPVLVGEGSC